MQLEMSPRGQGGVLASLSDSRADFSKHPLRRPPLYRDLPGTRTKTPLSVGFYKITRSQPLLPASGPPPAAAASPRPALHLAAPLPRRPPPLRRQLGHQENGGAREAARPSLPTPFSPPSPSGRGFPLGVGPTSPPTPNGRTVHTRPPSG